MTLATIEAVEQTERDTITLTPPWRLHADAAQILMRLYPDIDAVPQSISDILPAEHPAAVAVNNAGRAYLAAVQTLKELEALHEAGAIHPNYYAELGQAFEQFVRNEVQANMKSIVIDLPPRPRGAFSLRRGIRGRHLLELFNKAIGLR